MGIDSCAWRDDVGSFQLSFRRGCILNPMTAKARVRDVSLPYPCICSLLTPILDLCHTKLAVAVSS